MISEKDLRELAKKGVRFYVYVESGGCLDLSPGKVLRFASDPEKFNAGLHGVSLENYQAWVEWRTDDARYQCAGITGKGTRCRNNVIPSAYHWESRPEKFKDFKKGFDDRCRWHQGK